MSNSFKDFANENTINLPYDTFMYLKLMFPNIKQNIDFNEFVNYRLMHIAIAGDSKLSLKAIELIKKLNNELEQEQEAPKKLFVPVKMKTIDYKQACEEDDRRPPGGN